MWQGLVSDEMPVNTEEIERLNHILKLYEKENLRLVRDNESKQSIIEAHEKKKYEMENTRQNLLKKVKSLESTLKFERIAGEGLTKKVGLYEYEITKLREEKQIVELKYEKEQHRVGQLEGTFNKDRARLLQYVHEIELLSERNSDLEQRVKAAEDELRSARSDVLKKIQIAETMIAKTSQQQRTVHEQAEEMLALTREVYELRMRKNELVEITTAQEIKLGKHENSIDKLTAEVHRLRRELLEIAHTQSEKSLAFSTGLREDRITARQKDATDGDRRVIVNSKSGFEISPLKSRSIHSTYHSLDEDAANSRLDSTSRPYRQVPPPTNVISTESTAYRPQSEVQGTPKQSTTKASTWGPSTNPSNDFLETSIFAGSDTLHDQQTTKKDKVKYNVHNSLSGMGSRSLYLGQGLGLKQAREPAFSATGGTAKQVLKKILAEFEG